MVCDLQSPYPMRIKHKYLRNRHVYLTTWKRVRAKEHPYRTYCPCKSHYWVCGWKYHEDQIRDHFKWITEQTRYIVHGSHRCSYYNAPARYRLNLNHTRKAKERDIMAKIRQGDYDLDVPKFKNDAAWDYW